MQYVQGQVTKLFP